MATGLSVDLWPSERSGNDRIAPNASANNAAVIATETAKLDPRFSGVGWPKILVA